MDVNSPEAELWSENMRLKSENEHLRLALDIARTALLNIERRSEEGRAALTQSLAPKPELKPSRRADWHYDSQGYCDNPGRGY